MKVAQHMLRHTQKIYYYGSSVQNQHIEKLARDIHHCALPQCIIDSSVFLSVTKFLISLMTIIIIIYITFFTLVNTPTAVLLDYYF